MKISGNTKTGKLQNNIGKIFFGDMMKKPIYALLIMMMLVLSACSSQAPASQANAAPAAVPAAEQNTPANSDAAPAASVPQEVAVSTGLNADFENAESIGSQILLGIIKLEGSELALTKEQAATLLPLWDEYVTLTQKMAPTGGKPGETDTSATPEAPADNSEFQAQTDALIARIQAVFTADQISAIAEMKITNDIAQTIMKEKGISMGGPQQGDGSGPNGTPPADGQKPTNGQQPPADGQPAAGSGKGAPAQTDGNQAATNGQPGRSGGRMISPGLMSAAIKILETTSGLKSTSTEISAGLSPAEGLKGGTGGPNNSSSVNLKYGAVYQQSSGTESKTGKSYLTSLKDPEGINGTTSTI
jgi:hypothetical protein